MMRDAFAFQPAVVALYDAKYCVCLLLTNKLTVLEKAPRITQS